VRAAGVGFALKGFGTRWMAALMALGLSACAAEPPPPPPERPAVQNRRRPVVRRAPVPANPAPVRQEDAPAEASPAQPEAPPAARPSEEAAAQTRQERDRQVFVVCHERGNSGGLGVEAVATCLQTYNSTGVLPDN
jgi:hypothetical protein